MHGFNVYFAQAQTLNKIKYNFEQDSFIEALHIKTPIVAQGYRFLRIG